MNQERDAGRIEAARGTAGRVMRVLGMLAVAAGLVAPFMRVRGDAPELGIWSVVGVALGLSYWVGGMLLGARRPRVWKACFVLTVGLIAAVLVLILVQLVRKGSFRQAEGLATATEIALGAVLRQLWRCRPAAQLAAGPEAAVERAQ
jgi:hypothetical protein